MTMTDKDIILDYNQAKDKNSQIGILADLNQCSRETIREILEQGGEQRPYHSDTLAARCKQVLKEKGLSQSQFCRKYGLSQATVSQFIRGESKSSPAMMERIAAALDKLESGKEPPESNGQPKPVSAPEPGLQESVTLTPEEAEALLGLLTDVLPEYIEEKVANMDLLKVHTLTGIYRKCL